MGKVRKNFYSSWTLSLVGSLMCDRCDATAPVCASFAVKDFDFYSSYGASWTGFTPLPRWSTNLSPSARSILTADPVAGQGLRAPICAGLSRYRQAGCFPTPHFPCLSVLTFSCIHPQNAGHISLPQQEHKPAWEQQRCVCAPRERRRHASCTVIYTLTVHLFIL